MANVTAANETPDPRALTGLTYCDAARQLWSGTRIWDYLDYDELGRLWINDLCVIDAVARYGTPLEIVDTSLIERRAREWVQLSRDVAAEEGYSGRLHYYYAAKANMSSEVTHAAYRSGWHAETTSAQDLVHLSWLWRRGLLPVRPRVLCNGLKLPRVATAAWSAATGATSRIELPEDSLSDSLRGPSYAERILALARSGWDITPILDHGEVDIFCGADKPAMNAGVRLRTGRARSLDELDTLVDRLGMDRREVAEVAERVARSPNLTLTMFHAMVGSAMDMPFDDYLGSIAVAAGVWAELRKKHEQLLAFNIGGGIPPLGEEFDHRALLHGLFATLQTVSDAAGVSPPELVFEFGRLLAAESGFHAFGVLQTKSDAHGDREEGVPWLIVDGGLMAAIPDMLIIDQEFRFLAANAANEPAVAVRIGDPSCDPDGRYPPASFGNDKIVLVPATDEPLTLVIQGVGAYQEILAGVRGAHHCGLLEAIELIIEPRCDGTMGARIMPRQTWRDSTVALGYTDAAAEQLALVTGAPDAGSGVAAGDVGDSSVAGGNVSRP